jgi:predicted Fe-S protein YdhL (DUF1289 family)
MERVVKIFHSFEDAEAAEVEYWKNLSGEKKLEILEELRSRYWLIENEKIRRFQRIYKVLKRS